MKSRGIVVAFVAAAALALAGCSIGGTSYQGEGQNNLVSPSPSATPGEDMADVTNADGSKKTLPLIGGGDPANPESGPQANSDPRTPPVAGGKRTDTWGSLDTLLGNQGWYTSCANRTVGMSWKQDVPKFSASESTKTGAVDTRFILVVNSTVSDAQVRALAAEDNPNVGELHIKRVSNVVNTRGLGHNQCTEFVDTRPQVRVSLGKIMYKDGKPNHLVPTSGAFVDCHNPWRIPKAVKPVSKPKPPVSVKPSKTPPPVCKSKCNPTPPPKCVPPKPNGTPPNCYGPKANAPQPPGVEKPDPARNPVGPPQPRPAPKPSPLKPPPPGGGGQPPPTSPRPEPPPPPATGAPEPSTAPSTCVPPPGKTTC